MPLPDLVLRQEDGTFSVVKNILLSRFQRQAFLIWIYSIVCSVLVPAAQIVKKTSWSLRRRCRTAGSQSCPALLGRTLHQWHRWSRCHFSFPAVLFVAATAKTSKSVRSHFGTVLSIAKLSEIILRLQEEGAETIDLVTGSQLYPLDLWKSLTTKSKKNVAYSSGLEQQRLRNPQKFYLCSMDL